MPRNIIVTGSSFAGCSTALMVQSQFSHHQNIIAIRVKKISWFKYYPVLD